jgi:glycosyltransferase involved in cell wall biosynthesis
MMGASDIRPGTLAVIALTYNEEANLAQALDSVVGWADEIHVLDSLSTDQTVEIARRFGSHVAQNKFVDFAKQRNHALERLPIRSEWVLFLDADEWLPEALKQEISELIASSPLKMGSTLTGVLSGWVDGFDEVITRRGSCGCSGTARAAARIARSTNT